MGDRRPRWTLEGTAGGMTVFPAISRI